MQVVLQGHLAGGRVWQSQRVALMDKIEADGLAKWARRKFVSF